MPVDVRGAVFAQASLLSDGTVALKLSIDLMVSIL